MSDTIIGASYETNPSLRSMLADHAATDMPENLIGRGIFKIRDANSSSQRGSAGILVSKMYATRGYHGTTTATDDSSNRITLAASDHDRTIGTLTVSFDTDNGLLVDNIFQEEADTLRKAGNSLCEFTKLAVDTTRSKRVLASLFHVAYIFAYLLKGCNLVLIEVNPRHVRYYQRMLGFKVIGPERLNLRVNAPAVLLCLDFRHAQEQIEKFAGKADTAEGERSLYPYFFSIAEEAGIIGRLPGSRGP